MNGRRPLFLWAEPPALAEQGVGHYNREKRNFEKRGVDGMRYYAAPMEGITGYLYRRAHHRYFPGVDRYFTPFLSPSQFHKWTHKEQQEIAPDHNAGLPVVPQLLTKRAEDFLWAAEELGQRGFQQVNLNLGCPSGTVVAKGKGAGFLGRPEELADFLDEIFTKSPLKISIKTRLGLEDPEEFPALLALFNRYPVEELIVHARVQRDFYRGEARWQIFRQAYQKSVAPVYYNGDLFRAEECSRAGELCPGLEGVMAGRGLIANPALLRQAGGGKAASRSELRRFHDDLFEDYCQAFGSRRNAAVRMKELWVYLIELFEGGASYAKRLKKAVSPEEYSLAVECIFQELPLREELAPQANSPFQTGVSLL